jgi:hypothetical protein
MNDVLVLIVLMAGASLLVIALAVPMIRGRVGPNGYYGFRIPLTLENPEVWYPVNHYAGWLLLGYGLALLLAALVLPSLPCMTLGAYAIVMASLALGGMALVFLLGWRYARKMAGRINR